MLRAEANVVRAKRVNGRNNIVAKIYIKSAKA
jgi:hypothetical protein